MKKKLKLFNRKYRRGSQREDQVIDLDEEFDEEAYTDEDYADEDYEDYDDYDEDDYPDEEFEQEYGGEYEDEVVDEEIEQDYEDEIVDEEIEREYEDEVVDEEPQQEYEDEIVDEEPQQEYEGDIVDEEPQQEYEGEIVGEEPQPVYEDEFVDEAPTQELAAVEAIEEDVQPEEDLEYSDVSEPVEDLENSDVSEPVEDLENFDASEPEEDAEYNSNAAYDEDVDRGSGDEYDSDTDYLEEDDYDSDRAEQDFGDEYAGREYHGEGAGREYDDGYADEEYNGEGSRREHDDDYADQEYDDDYADQEYDDYADQEYEDDYADQEYDDDYAERDYEDGYADQDYDEDYVATRRGRKAVAASGYEGGSYLNNRRKKNGKKAAAVGAGILKFIRESSVAERAAAIVAVLLIAGAVATMVLYSKAKDYSAEIGSFAEVGAGLNVDDAIGAYGLLAIADAEKARAYAASMVTDEEEEQEEEVSDVAEGVTVQMTLTSIKSDMKIKFINSESSKLVSNVHFEVEVVTPDGTKVSYDDHDKDGIIYKNNLTAGTYKVTPKALSSEYSEYKLETETKSLKIKDTVEMKAVDVSNEIKKESQVNAAVEDTAVADVIESALQDTVEYVESSKTPIDGDGGDGEYSYESIDKSQVADPSSSSKLTAGSVKRMSAARARTENPDGENSEDEQKNEEENTSDSDSSSEEESTEPEKPKTISVNPSSISLKVGENESFIVSGPDSYNVSISNSSVAELDGDSVTAVGAGSATITITADGYEDAQISVSVEGGKQEDEEEKVKGEITLSATSLTLDVGETGKLTASGADNIKFKSNDESVAKVKNDGVITAIAAGSATITAYADGYNDAKCEITVRSKDSSSSDLAMNVSKVTLVVGQTFKLSPKDSSLSVKYSSDNSDIASVSGGTIKGVKAGETTITASCDGYNDAKIKVKVVKGSTVLKDKEGRTVYVKNSEGKYVEATYDDYYNGSKFYIRKAATSYRYTGWQTIDGRTYYFDKNGNYVTGEQVIQGAKYSFGSDGALSSSSGTLGIDVSKWNGNINWSQVKNSGVNFVIIRCGYRGSSAGALIEDPKFRANIQGATAAGLRVGVYFFTQAVNEVEAVEEASMCINLCKGYNLSFPIFLDVEASNGRGDSVSTSQRTANIRAFCGTIQSAGYRAGVYANKTWFSQKINTSQLTSYKIWLAQYAASVSYNATRYDMWQYTSKGSVSGISGNVDMNILYNP